MGLFDFFKKKKQINHNKQNNVEQISPADAFKMLGSNGYLFWDAFVEGQNLAVEKFNDFKKFKEKLDSFYSDIDFNRTISNLKGLKNTVEIKVKHAMYLYMNNLDKDYYVTIDGLNDTILLTHSDFKNILTNLSNYEIEYCDELVSFIRENIHSLVAKTDMKRFGYEMTRRLLPINSLELYKYHESISERIYTCESNEGDKLQKCLFIPYIVEKNSIDNPMIISEITATSAFVMDYLCYATMWLPTYDFVRFFKYEDDSGRSVKSVAKDVLGQKFVDYLTQVVVDLNGNMFRTSVYSGLLIE